MDTHKIARLMVDEVKKAMKDQGVSQRELSQMTGIPRNTLNSRLADNTTRHFNLGELAQVVDALGLSVVEVALRAERASMQATAA